MKLHEILKAERKRLGTNLNDLADMMNDWDIDTSSSTLSRVENGWTPTFPIVQGYCRLFGWSLGDLDRYLGDDSLTEQDPIPKLPITKKISSAVGREIPIVSWMQAGSWKESPHIESHEQDQIFVTGKLPKNTFALRVSGKSMENCDGKNHFPDGSLILVNPDIDAKIDDFVVAVDEATQEATFKRLIEDCGNKFFVPLNSQFPVTKVTETTVIRGVVFRVIDDRKV